MKLKTITLISLFLFIAFFAGLLVLPSDFLSSLSTTSQSTSLNNNLNNSGAVSQVDPLNVLTIENIAKHNTQADCYLTINGAVYDVSNYINQHPGGAKNITTRCGGEATKVFSTIHSNFAWNLLKKFYLGNVGSASASVSGVSKIAPISSTESGLTDIEQALKKIYPNGEIIKVEPKKDFFMAKVINDNKLYEVHISKSGEVIKTEVENDEVDWSEWDEDEEYEDD